MAYKFKNPSNDFVESSPCPWLWALLFGPIYFACKGVWRHYLIGILLLLPTLGISLIIYAIFAGTIVKNHYARNGWTQIETSDGEKEDKEPNKGGLNLVGNVVLGVCLTLAVLMVIGYYAEQAEQASQPEESELVEFSQQLASINAGKNLDLTHPTVARFSYLLTFLSEETNTPIDKVADTTVWAWQYIVEDCDVNIGLLELMEELHIHIGLQPKEGEPKFNNYKQSIILMTTILATQHDAVCDPNN